MNTELTNDKHGPHKGRNEKLTKRLLHWQKRYDLLGHFNSLHYQCPQ